MFVAHAVDALTVIVAQTAVGSVTTVGSAHVDAFTSDAEAALVAGTLSSLKQQT